MYAYSVDVIYRLNDFVRLISCFISMKIIRKTKLKTQYGVYK